jgi:hypothetical protein
LPRTASISGPTQTAHFLDEDGSSKEKETEDEAGDSVIMAGRRVQREKMNYIPVKIILEMIIRSPAMNTMSVQ